MKKKLLLIAGGVVLLGIAWSAVPDLWRYIKISSM